VSCEVLNCLGAFIGEEVAVDLAHRGVYDNFWWQYFTFLLWLSLDRLSNPLIDVITLRAKSWLSPGKQVKSRLFESITDQSRITFGLRWWFIVHTGTRWILNSHLLCPI
jgi:hypothetical protein